jgi:hypothetical protein
LTTEPHKIAEVALSKSADDKTIAGSLPPNSKKAGTNRLAAVCPTYFSTRSHTASKAD